MQGLYLKGYIRPASKKAVKEALAVSADNVTAEATSVFGNEYGGLISDMPDNSEVHFVGPDPYTKRNFYGTITRKGDKFTVR